MKKPALFFVVPWVAAGIFYVRHQTRPAGTSDAASSAAPVIERVLDAGGRVLWSSGASQPFALKAGQVISLEGRGFGAGPDVDLSKVLVGKVRAVERDLTMMLGETKIKLTEFPHLNRVQYAETAEKDVFAGEEWPQTSKKDILSWNDSKIVFRVPLTASEGPIVVQVQKKQGSIASPVDPSKPHLIPDPIFERVLGDKRAEPALTVDAVGPAVTSNEVPVGVENRGFAESVKRGEAIYWAFDYNMGLAHALVHVEWDKMFKGEIVDPFTGKAFDPVEQIGAIKITKDKVMPEIARSKYDFVPSPMPMPIKAPISGRQQNVKTYPTGYVGYTWASANNPLDLSFQAKNYIGFNCASCHSREITFEKAPGVFVTKVFNGIPNNKWSMKFAAMGDMTAVRGNEAKPEELPPSVTYSQFNLKSAFRGTEKVDKRSLIYYMNPGTADMTLSRTSLERYTMYRNDFLFSPTAISIITRHTPLRRALSRTEAIAGFEGSYIHAQEPDGALGALSAKAMTDLTSYMTTMDADDPLLAKIGMYEWLKKQDRLPEIAGASQAEFLASSYDRYPALNAHIEQGRRAFEKSCARCHQANFGTYTDENMFALKDVGSYFSPTAWNRQVNALRTAPLRDLYWVQARGLLHDGSLRVSLNAEDKDYSDSARALVHPDRCDQGSALYKRLYTLNEHSYRIPKGTPEQEKAVRQQHYFVDLPGATPEQAKYLYWDYQSMRKNFGVIEFGAKTPTPMPATPHPWCADSAEAAESLAYFLMTL